MSYDQIGVKGHVGVTGVKKVIFTKKIFKSNRFILFYFILFASKEAYPIVRQLEKKKTQAKVVKCLKKKMLGP